MQICKKCTKHNSSLQYFTLLSMLFCTFAPKILKYILLTQVSDLASAG